MLQIVRLSSDDESNRRVQNGDVAIGVLGAAEHAVKRRRVGGWIASGEIGERRAGNSSILGRDFKGANVAVLKRGDEGGAGGRRLVETVGAMHEPHSLGATIAHHLRERFE